ncbi:MAG: aldo/keto reductase [Bacilli bacterium]|nr:aldo/keto reductase [Bacilli bacterium]
MEYRLDKYGNKVSQLGYGCMRFTKHAGVIDFEKAEKEIMFAYEHGVNYYDTAYLYPGSEECLGRILAKNGIREKVYIATKLPQYAIRKDTAIEKTFQEELKRLQTTYVDYYLMHMMTDYAEWENLLSLGILDFIKRHKEDGSIRQIGFSYHGETEMFLKILNAYDWDFAQIQYNYLDEHSQAGRRGLEEARNKGVPIVIMEPLRGGKLVNLPKGAKDVMAKSGHDYSPAEWGLRWLWNQEGILCVLSGMNSLEMVEENIRVASSAQIGDFKEEEFEVIAKAKKIIKEKEKVGCTGCRYCMPCPKGVDIPSNFYYYNLLYIDKKMQARFEFAQNMGLRLQPGFASQCIECGACEKHCPQHLPIRKLLKEADKHLRPFPYNVGIKIARKILVKDAKKK